MRRLCLPILMVLALAGCERADRGACPAGDLAEFGRAEGARGAAATLPGPGCALDAAEQQHYAEGRADGLARYCVGKRGYELALDGKSVNLAVCAGDAARELQRGFEIGGQLRTHLQQRDQLLKEADTAERAAAKLPEDSPERRKLEDEAAGKRFDARQRENDVEALRGIVALEQWR